MSTYMTLLLWTLVFSLSTCFSVTLLGDRRLISGDLLHAERLVRLIFHWKFITAFLLAFVARASFLMVNNTLLKVDDLAKNSTTITAFVTTVAYIFIIGTNYLFLGERVTANQLIGCVVIIVGICILVR
jgi:drug/metabolite transporter (DMT)-like permease